MSIDLEAIANDINVAEDIASKLAPFISFIPGFGSYAAAILAAIPQIVKATHAIEQDLGHPVGSAANTQTLADGINPTSAVILPGA